MRFLFCVCSLKGWLSKSNRQLVVSGLATVADELEAANHLADGEETEDLGEDDAASDELGSSDAADGLEESAGRDGAVADGLEEVLVVGLEGGDGAVIWPC